jgi:hypothetical protein
VATAYTAKLVAAISVRAVGGSERVGGLPPGTFGVKVLKRCGLGADLWKSGFVRQLHHKWALGKCCEEGGVFGGGLWRELCALSTVWHREGEAAV